MINKIKNINWFMVWIIFVMLAGMVLTVIEEGNVSSDYRGQNCECYLSER